MNAATCRLVAAGLLLQVAEPLPDCERRVYRFTELDLRARLIRRASRSGWAPTREALWELRDAAIDAIRAQVPEGFTLPGWLEQATPEDVTALLRKAAAALDGQAPR